MGVCIPHFPFVACTLDRKSQVIFFLGSRIDFFYVSVQPLRSRALQQLQAQLRREAEQTQPAAGAGAASPSTGLAGTGIAGLTAASATRTPA